jgi:phage regulator Rha-like protein
MVEKPVNKKREDAAVATEAITGRILVLRGQRVMLDTDLAALFDVPTGRFNEAVQRNLARFPADFMFPLNNQDLAALRSQIATLKTGRGQHRKYAPYAFTEHGAIMAATILNSPRATQVSVYVVRAFVRMREEISAHKVLALKLDALEQRIDSQDETIVDVLAAIRQLMTPPEPKKKRPIGFTARIEK